MLATHGHAIPITTITTMHLYSHAGNTWSCYTYNNNYYNASVFTCWQHMVMLVPITTITTMHLYSHAGNTWSHAIPYNNNYYNASVLTCWQHMVMLYL